MPNDEDDISPDDRPETLAELIRSPDSFTVADELAEMFGKPAPLRVAMDGGLPTAAPDAGGAYAPPLTPEMFVCIADESSFVIRDEWGAVTHSFERDRVERAPNGEWRTKFDPGAGIGAVLVSVEPIRPACEHYLEQLDPPEPGQRLRYGRKRRYCTYRRTAAGAFNEMSDTALRACSARRPRDIPSEQLMRDFDAEKIEQGRKRVMLPLFPAWATKNNGG